MGMYGDLLNKLDDGQFVKIESGKAVRLRLLDHPHISQKEYTDQETGEKSINTRFTWAVWDYEQSRVRILEQGKSVFKQIATAADTWPQGEDMPSPFDVVVKRNGSGRFDTEYVVAAVPHQGTMPQRSTLELPDIAAKSGGIPIQQVMQGKTPPLSLPGNKGMSATHTDAERPSDDVVIQDLDTSQEVDLESIPF
jgi:hypothetical protein